MIKHAGRRVSYHGLRRQNRGIVAELFMMINDDTLKQLLLQLCKWLNEKRYMETSSHLIPPRDQHSSGDLIRIRMTG